jgi:hypothetical protein
MSKWLLCRCFCAILALTLLCGGGPLSQRAYFFALAPSVHGEGGVIVVSYPELFQLLNLIVSIITLMVVINDKKK